MAHVIPRKGADEEFYVAGLVADAIEWMGHAKVILKFDNEAAIRALSRQIIQVVKAKGTDIERLVCIHSM